MKKLRFALCLISIITCLTTNHLAAADSTPANVQKLKKQAQLKKLTRNPRDPQQSIQEKAYAKFAKHVAGLNIPIYWPSRCWRGNRGAYHLTAEAIIIAENNDDNEPYQDQEGTLLHELGHALHQKTTAERYYKIWDTYSPRFKNTALIGVAVMFSGAYLGAYLDYTQKNSTTTLPIKLAITGVVIVLGAVFLGALQEIFQAKISQDEEREADAFANKHASSIEELKKRINFLSRYLPANQPSNPSLCVSVRQQVREWTNLLACSTHPTDESRIQAIQDEIERRKREGITDPMRKSLAKYVQEQNPRSWYQRIKKFLQHTSSGMSLVN